QRLTRRVPLDLVQRLVEYGSRVVRGHRVRRRAGLVPLLILGRELTVGGVVEVGRVVERRVHAARGGTLLGQQRAFGEEAGRVQRDPVVQLQRGVLLDERLGRRAREE